VKSSSPRRKRGRDRLKGEPTAVPAMTATTAGSDTFHLITLSTSVLPLIAHQMKAKNVAGLH